METQCQLQEKLKCHEAELQGLRNKVACLQESNEKVKGGPGEQEYSQAGSSVRVSTEEWAWWEFSREAADKGAKEVHRESSSWSTFLANSKS